MFLNEPKLILYHTVKWFQVLLCITNNSFKQESFVYTVKWPNSSISPIDTTLSDSTTLAQSGLGSDPIYQPLRSGRILHKVNFEAEFNRFEFRVFLLLD